MLNSIYWELNNKYLTTFALLKGDKIEWFYLLVWQVRSILKIQGKNVFSIIMLRQQSKKYVISETSRRKQVIQVFHLFFYLSLYFYFFFLLQNNKEERCLSVLSFPMSSRINTLQLVSSNSHKLLQTGKNIFISEQRQTFQVKHYSLVGHFCD